MINDNIANKMIEWLMNEEGVLVGTNNFLISKGYLINDSKKTKVEVLRILQEVINLHEILDNEQTENINVIMMKI